MLIHYRLQKLVNNLKLDLMLAEILREVDTEKYFKTRRIKHKIIHKNLLLVEKIWNSKNKWTKF